MPLSFIPAWLAITLLVLGILGLLFRSKIAKAVVSKFPLFPANTWLMIFAVVGILAGGLPLLIGGVTGLFQGSVASITGGAETSAGVSAASVIACQFNSAPTEGLADTNMTFRSDPSDLKHYYADVGYVRGAGFTINGSLYCTDSRPNIRDGVSHDCWAIGDTFRSETSSTDSNVYQIVETKSSASKVPGQTWAQTIYLKDSGTTAAGAASSDPQERADFVFAQDSKNEYLGYNLTLTSSTIFEYLNNQTSKDVKFVCDGNQVARLTITKTTQTS